MPQIHKVWTCCMCLLKAINLPLCISSLSSSTWTLTFRMTNWVHHFTGLHSAPTSLLSAIFWLGELMWIHKISRASHLCTSVCLPPNNPNRPDWFVIFSLKARMPKLLTKRIEQLMPTLQWRLVVQYGRKLCARSSEKVILRTRSLGISYSSSFKSSSHCTNNISRRLPWISSWW